MGMYTELHFNAELKEDTPEEVIALLRFMLGDIEEQMDPSPEHLFFKTTRWNWMLKCDSYYFAADTHSTLRYDDIGRCRYLCIRCNLKNYDDEIEHFLDWIMPYIDASPGDFLGFHRYEENEEPTVIYLPGG